MSAPITTTFTPTVEKGEVKVDDLPSILADITQEECARSGPDLIYEVISRYLVPEVQVHNNSFGIRFRFTNMGDHYQVDHTVTKAHGVGGVISEAKKAIREYQEVLEAAERLEGHLKSFTIVP